MSASPLIAGVLVLACVLAVVRLLWRPPQAERGRRMLLALLQLPLTLALLLVLHPPAREHAAGVLVVLGPGATSSHPAGVVVALPEAPPATGEADMTRVPDLATALRQHPGTTRVQVIGDGLPARDRDAAGAVSVQFSPADDTSPALLAFVPPPITAPGAGFPVHARVRGLAGGRAELLDPAGRRVDRSVLDAEGTVSLRGVARDAGEVTFRLRLYAGDGAAFADVPVPLQVQAATPPRVLLLSAAANPETKYLRRWLADSGSEVHATIAAGNRLELGDAPVTLDARRLAATDLLILDARSLQSLGPAARARVRDAVGDGLGVLLRLEDGADAATRAAAAQIGLHLRGDARAAPLALAGMDEATLLARRGLQQHAGIEATASATQADARSRVATPPPLTSWRVQLDDARAHPLPLLGGAVPGQWRAHRGGRIGLLTAADSYQLVLAGREDLHAQLWADAVGTLARPPVEADATRSDADDHADDRASGPVELPGIAWAGERNQVCGLADAARMTAPDGSEVMLVVDPATGASRCAAWWPRAGGWHLLQAHDRLIPLHVFEPRAMAGLHTEQMRQHTLALAGPALADDGDGAPEGAHSAPGPRWPWLLLFVLLATLGWWLERRWLRGLSRPA